MRFGKWAVLLAALALLLPAGSAAAIGDLNGAYDRDGLSFHYPADWLIADRGADVFLGTSEATLGLMDSAAVPAVPRAELGLIITHVPPDFLSAFRLTADSTPLELMDALVLSFDMPSSILFGAPFARTAGPNALARVDGATGDSDLAFIIIKLEGGFALLGAVAAAGEIGRWDGPLYALIRSMEYKDPFGAFYAEMRK